MEDINIDDLDLDIEEADYGEKFDSKRKSQYEVPFLVLDDFGSLSKKAFSPKFKYISWRGNKRFDLRMWKNEDTFPCKGVTFTNDELLLAYSNTNVNLNDFSNEDFETIIIKKRKVKLYKTLVTLSVIDESNITWYKEINVIDWGYGLKIDIRKWSLNHTKCSRGIAIDNSELQAFRKIIKENNLIDLYLSK